MAGRGTGVFLPLMPPAPLPGSGFAVKVYGHADLSAYSKAAAGKGPAPTPLATIKRFQQLSWSPEISDVGAGSITLHLDDKLWTYPLSDGRAASALLDYSNLWVVEFDGQWRGEFFCEKIEKATVPQDGRAGKTVTVSGPGSGQALAWASVMTPYYPKPVPKGKLGFFQFVNVPVMGCWLQLLQAAQRRRTIGYVRCRFTAARDSAGVPWEDTPPAKPKTTATTTVGDVLFDVDSSALNDAGKAAVAAIAKKLAKVTYPRVLVVGHADSSGTVAHNYQLGLDRANTVRNAILAIQPMAQVDAASRGETQPVASNRTAAGRRKNRRVVVTYQTGPIPADTVFRPDKQTRLLDLLKQLTSGQTTAENRGPIHCEWIMDKGFGLRVQSQIGVDRSAKVVFHEGSTYLSARGDSYDRADIANVVAVYNMAGVYRVATSPSSIARFGQREMFTELQGSYSDKVHAQIANTQLSAYHWQVITATITISPGPGRMPFQDFGLGDWIGLVHPQAGRPSIVDKQRVMAITMIVNEDGNDSYELTVSGINPTRISWLKMQVEALLNRKPGIRAFQQADEPAGLMPGDFWTPWTPDA